MGSTLSAIPSGTRSAFLRGIGILGERRCLRAGHNVSCRYIFGARGNHRSIMERPATRMLRIGDWCANPESGELSRNGEIARVEVRTMRLLLCLAEHAGEVVSIEELLNQVWPDVVVAPDSVYQAVTSLRRLLGDDSKQPTYIATVPRLGYRMVATVSPWADESSSQIDSSRPSGSEELAPPAADAPKKPGPRFRAGFTWAAGVALCLAVVIAFLFHGKVANNDPSASSTVGPTVSQPQKSIAVLPFLDLTDEMNQEPFADGMTEELIDKLSKIPGLRVPPPTSSFYFKSKLWPRSKEAPQTTIADISKA